MNIIDKIVKMFVNKKEEKDVSFIREIAFPYYRDLLNKDNKDVTVSYSRYDLPSIFIEYEDHIILTLYMKDERLCVVGDHICKYFHMQKDIVVPTADDSILEEIKKYISLKGEIVNV